MADDSVQPVPWVFLVATRGVASRVNDAGMHQHVDAFGALAVAALDQHRARAAIAQAPGLRQHLVLVARHRLVEQRRGFRQIGRDDQRARNEHALEHVDRFRIEQPVAGGRDHHRVEHHVLRLPAVEPGCHRLDHRRLREHADLHRPHVEIGEHRIDLRRDEIRRHVVDAGDALGVLRGQRGDDAGAIDAERGEGLQVGLDAGAAAGIRAGNGDGDRRS